MDMIGRLYEKTKTWGPGSCMVAFYFFSLIPIVVTTAYGIYMNGWTTLPDESRDLSLFLNSLFFAPWFETLLLNVMLTKLFSKMKCRPTTTIVAVALIFAAAHTANGWISPLLVFIPALMFQWNYYLYFDKQEAGWGFLSTTVLHFLYNFTIFVVIPLIYVVLDIYYNVGGLGILVK
jgi:hypothetical protein